MTLAWYNSDPRETVSKRAKIIIYTGEEALLGDVDTKECWNIWTNHAFERYKSFGSQDEWPSHWIWTYRPVRQEAVPSSVET